MKKRPYYMDELEKMFSYECEHGRHDSYEQVMATIGFTICDHLRTLRTLGFLFLGAFIARLFL